VTALTPAGERCQVVMWVDGELVARLHGTFMPPAAQTLCLYLTGLCRGAEFTYAPVGVAPPRPRRALCSAA